MNDCTCCITSAQTFSIEAHNFIIHNNDVHGCINFIIIIMQCYNTALKERRNNVG